MTAGSDLRGVSRHADQSADVRPDVPFGWTDLIIALTLATAFIVLHVAIPGVVPSGADPGGWLAMAKERFGVEVLAATDATYLPGFPVLLGSILAVTNSLSAITAAGVISKVALVLAVYIAVRPVGLGYAAAAAVMVGMSGAYGEMYAWGGFPQQLGTALGVVATFYLIRYVQSRNVWHLSVSAVAVALTLFTHNLVGGLLVGALLLAVVHWLYLTRADRKTWTSGLLDAATLVLPAGAFVGVALVLGRGAGVQPSLNPNELTWGQSIEHMIGEAPIPWLVLTAIALALGMSRKWSGPNALTVAVGGSWLVASLVFFLVVGEPRALLFDPNGSRDDCDLGVRGTATEGERPGTPMREILLQSWELSCSSRLLRVATPTMTLPRTGTGLSTIRRSRLSINSRTPRVQETSLSHPSGSMGFKWVGGFRDMPRGLPTQAGVSTFWRRRKSGTRAPRPIVYSRRILRKSQVFSTRWERGSLS